MKLVAARDITVADLPYISNPFFAKNDVRDAYCGGFTSIHNLNEFVPWQWRNYQQGLDELLKKIDKMEVCLVYSMKLPFLGVVYWQQDPDSPNNPQKGRWVASLSGINQYANLQGIVSSAYSKNMVPQTHSQQSSLQSSTAKTVVNQGFENSVEGGSRKTLSQRPVMAKPAEAERGDHVLQEATAFKQADFASTYSMRLSQTPAETNDVVGTALTAGGLRTGLGLSRGTVVSSSGERVVPDNEAVLSRLSQPGGLVATEGNQVLKFNGKLSNPTHPLFKHGPDVTDQYIYDRVANELVAKNRTGLRTAFNDRAQMESAISETFSLKQKEINAWIASNPKAGIPRAFEANPGMGNLGRGYEVTTKGGPVVPINQSMPNVNLVLIPDGKGSFLIHTAHPF